MADFQIGDVVSLARHSGLWVVMGSDNAMPPGRRWRVQTDAAKVPLNLVVGDGDMTLVQRPTFTAGQRVRYVGGDAQVITDKGVTVRIRYTWPRQASLGGKHELETDAGRGQLVGLNYL